MAIDYCYGRAWWGRGPGTEALGSCNGCYHGILAEEWRAARSGR